MMKKENKSSISYQNRLLLFFIAGILGGTITANLLSEELKQQIGYFDTLFLSEQALNMAQKQQMWLFVLRQRCMELLGAWLLSLTVFSAVGFCGAAALVGGSVGVVLSVITAQKGLLGLVFYLGTILPQALFYIPIGLILASWAGEEKHPIRIPAILLLSLLLVVGTAAEAWLSPIVVSFITKL